MVTVLLALSGCVSIPTRGPVEKVEGQQPACQNCVNVEVAPPAAGDDPMQIVNGYLRANSNYQPNYAVAEQYLTRAAAEKWSPEVGVSVYVGAPRVNGNRVTLIGQQVGFLRSDRTYTARSSPLNRDFGLVQEDGQWRISDPPPGLFVAEYFFQTFYQPYDLFFLGSTGSLVPDSIHLPDLRNPPNFASALVKALLEGPSDWLEPAVSTAVPQGTTLSLESVTITGGTAEVPLSSEIATLTDAQRSLLAAQLVHTLKQVTGVRKVLLLVNSQPFRVPESEADGLAIPVEAIPRALDPVPAVTANQLYAVRRGGAVQQVTGSVDAPQAEGIAGPAGEGRYDVDTLAVAAAGSRLALVTDNGTVLRRASTTDRAVRTLLSGVTGLLRPQITRNGETWVVGEQDGRQRFFVAAGDRAVAVDAPVLAEGRVTAFRLAPDGTRVALVVQDGNRTRLGLARILRSDTTVVDGWRPLDTAASQTTPDITRIRDLAWTDATNLLVLTATTPDSPFSPTRISDDASRIQTEPEPNDWDAREVTVLARTETAIVVAQDGRTFRNDGQQWRTFVRDVVSIAYPG